MKQNHKEEKKTNFNPNEMKKPAEKTPSSWPAHPKKDGCNTCK